MGKKGQITIFIIIAIVVISVSSLVYFFYPNIKITGFKNDPIYSYLNECIEESVLASTILFGYQQGYSNPPEKTLEINSSKVAYYYFKREVYIPNNKFFEEELSKIINERLSMECTDFLFFEEDGYLIESENPSSDVEILEEELKIKVDFPVTATYGEDTLQFSEFDYNFPIRMGHILDTSRNVVEKIQEEPDNIDLTFFLEQDLGISINEYDNCNQVYIITDPESISRFGDEEYTFTFATKLNEQYCE